VFPVKKAEAKGRSCGAVRMPIDLYHVIGSPPCHSVRVLIKALGVGVNLKDVDFPKEEHKSPEYVKVGLVLDLENMTHCSLHSLNFTSTILLQYNETLFLNTYIKSEF
jgi:hypothetical protein